MEERNKRKKRIIGTTIAFMLTLMAIVGFIYKDEILQAYADWRAEQTGWKDDTEDLGKIELPQNTEVVQEQEEYVTDSLGIRYVKTKFFNRQYEVLIPKEWKITTSQNRIQAMHPNYKNMYAQIEISITPLGEYINDISLLKLRNESFDLFNIAFRYNGYSDVYKVFTYEVSNNHVEKDNYLYQPLTLRLQSTTVSGSKYEPYIANYYTLLGEEGYQITVCGPKNQEIAIEEISQMVVKSFKESKQTVDINEYPLQRFDLNVAVDEKKQSFNYSINKEWEKVYDAGRSTSNICHIYKLTDDISKPEYGMFLTVQIVPKADLKVESYNKYLSTMYAHGPYYNIDEFARAMTESDSETNVKVYSEETYYKGSYKGKISNYIKFFIASNKNPYYNAIQVGNYPVYNYMYALNISKDYDMLINITHNGETNSELAYEYLMKFISKVSF